MEAKSIIEFKDVNKIYDNGTVGLKDINLTVQPGEFLVVVGLSGAGKSTLMRTINQMHRPSSGSVLVDGVEVTDLKGRALRELRRKVGMIFQNFNLVKRTTVEHNVLSGKISYYPTWKSLLNLYTKADKLQAAEALDRVNLLEKLYMRADQLSGGQQQRVAIARTLMQDPKIILADEPIASLDPLTTRAVMNDLKKLNQEDGITVVVNLHSVPLALEYADRIVGMRAGQLVYDEPINRVTESDLNAIYQSV
ncbi:phosphonate ABC transporter ATP-binding protein [Levilactobacillus bambusae]|uniref:Phosphonate ABC transporter ATP-binding protein n=1 Tax=Levilactobacillus bambusae TaxID=2024736 RepID=A0A2V1N099_9LACO|nr:phosphonate ABC transporter ATP-binding protein [Levilactobacillus bambusae]PWG00443.1 phosphonate ABC transporter ATP-binding protein [Levilactobacillus bambusae]